MTQITVADLNNAKLDVDTIAGIANGTGVSVVDRLGATRLTANEAVRQMGYQVPVTYATSLVMSTLTQTVDYLGVVYAPLPTMIPFTTSGTFETTKFYVIQNNEIVKKYNTYADILASGGAILDGTRADMSGYHAIGDGGENRFFYSASSTATDNGGTVIKPTSVIGAGRWISTSYLINLEMFGAVLDGTTDNSTAFAAAINASAGREIEIKTGKICKINTAQSFSVGFRISGGGTILINVPTGQTAIAVSGSVRLDNIILDGNNVSNELINCTGAKLEIYGGEVKNVYRAAPTDNVTGVQANGVNFVRIRDVVFSRVCCGANSTIGDAAGAVAAVQIVGSCANGRITNCTFDDVNNRLATITGTLQFEDAEAIRCYSTTGDQNVKVEGCYFTNIGKRAAKFLGTSASVYGFNNNDCLSPYTGTADDPDAALGTGMFSMASCYSGHFSADKNRFNGGTAGTA